MDITNFIESQYREIEHITNFEYINLYKSIQSERLQIILSTLHKEFQTLFKLMNDRLPTKDSEAHFWADPSRELIHIIQITNDLIRELSATPYAFQLDEYYTNLISNCETFLSESGGSALPPNMNKVILYYTKPMFIFDDTVAIKKTKNRVIYQLKQNIGSGSYADVFKYKDEFYNKEFAIKVAKKNLTAKELLRFKEEYNQMKELNSPYIVEVYNYDEQKHMYYMELMDVNLYHYILQNNDKLSFTQRKNIGNQILKAFYYIHSKGLFHRDINPKNVLLKIYDDTQIVKIADFGLVKVPNLQMTSFNTDMKGWFNDPSLELDGFSNYNISHEIFALTRLLYFVLTGKTNISKNKDNNIKKFLEIGLNPDKNIRFKNIQELANAFKNIPG
ncbi:protein kinase [Enterococcus sp. C62]|uniref:protein kinase domain-containing protein n=1 Tax=Enterococcus TaxID=1350 RepID=UPI0019E139DF|nr:protein kinase [Enterococcus hirae]EMF0528049.1 protein kinase [Enterococcus hirae]EMF0597402.1 protein kinase [Enterococcus hirae]